MTIIMTGTPLTQHVEVRKNLLEISEEIHRSSWRRRVVLTWNLLCERNGKAKTVAFTILGVAGALTATGYSAMSMMFGGLAFQQALDEYHEGEVRPSVIGHLAEWTMLGIFTLQLTVKLIGDTFQLGRLEQIKEVFNRYISDTNLHHEVREQLYLEMQDYLASQALQQQPFFLNVRTLPNPAALTLSDDINSTLKVDQKLQPVYDEIHNEVKNAPQCQLAKKGWQEIEWHHGTVKSGILKTVLAVAGIFCLWNLGIYCLGIFWSGQQAADDLHAGVNPSIGGHALEWGAEAVAMLGLGVNFFFEIASIGKAKLVTELFHDKMNQSDDDDSDQVETQVRSKRLFSEMKRQFRLIPEGWFFKLPEYLQYRGVPNTGDSIEVLIDD